MAYRYFLSFRRFLVVEEYDIMMEANFHHIYKRIGLFFYRDLGAVDSYMDELMEEE